MSDAIHIYSTEPIDLDVALLRAEAEKWFGYLLGQKGNGLLDIEFFCGTQIIEDLLAPDDRIYGFIERHLIGSGAYIYYGIDEYWQEHSLVPLYEFCIAELPRSKKNALLIVGLSIAIAVAKILCVDFIVDYSGIWIKEHGDEVFLGDLLKLAIHEELSLDVAIQKFYEKAVKL